MKKLKELVRIFKETYQRANEDKVLGKEYLDKIEALLKTKQEIYEKLTDLGKDLAGCKEYIPSSVWNHFYLPAQSFLLTGYQNIKRINGTPFVSVPKPIGYLADLEMLNGELKEKLGEAKELYEKGDYQAIEGTYKDTLNLVIKRLGYYK